ncbi:DUF4268 domain-containing protein [Phaeobacter inhibens]|uniref:DUF4268 domain-containing protein n=1 Tax=Phaeobacter inhibens TaxID=221822 RepID=UPI0021A94551|nr:DUF4268 domain-containing protein [Phaeobacter inhibens]UWR67322.1 DUF4268 domain-containing protein [Phaeobacter inhibens]UWR71256.1 DUF4268 domain-containing protein [Phaeobacter inhibens]
MFRVDLNQNRLSRLSQKRFSELNLRERDHLQEWLANQPDALGEELLIIQKEFDGFDETRERLDLLALDKDGNLVVIENKLDDSGRDVTWQALKYTAYVSGLTKTQIVDIYQQYLDRYAGGGNAAVRICEFMEVEELEETVLNPGNDQRMIFIAANFRREVTATVLWLLSRGIRAQCFKVTPYAFGDELMVDIQQIIPTPEAADFMIGMSSKENEEKAIQDTQKKRHKLRLDFWEAALEQLRVDGVKLYQNISPTKDHWLSAGSGTRSCPYQMIFSRDEARVEISLQRSETAENKWLFDQLYSQKDAIEAAFGAELDWRRMDDKKASRIVYAQPFEGFNREAWPEMIGWLAAHIQKLEAAFSEPLARLNRQVRSQDEAT